MALLIVLFVCLAAPWTHGQFIEIRSELFDIRQQVFKRVSGVGSMIQANKKFFVITAAHVSSGRNLEMLSDGGEPLTPMRVWNDPDADISLIEVMPNENQVKKYLLATLATHSDFKGSRLITGLGRLPDVGETNTMFNVRDQKKYRSQIVDMYELTRDISISPFDRRFYPPEILIAPWLRTYSRIEWSRKIGTDPQDLREESIRNSGEQVLNLRISFPKGYSGSPILINHGANLWSTYSLYTLGGILTHSNFQGRPEDSRVAGQEAIGQLITKATSQEVIQESGSTTTPIWYLIDEYFAQIKEGLLIVHIYGGPIGNGIGATGLFPITKEGTSEEVTLPKINRNVLIKFDSTLKKSNESPESNQNLVVTIPLNN